MPGVCYLSVCDVCVRCGMCACVCSLSLRVCVFCVGSLSAHSVCSVCVRVMCVWYVCACYVCYLSVRFSVCVLYINVCSL